MSKHKDKKKNRDKGFFLGKELVLKTGEIKIKSHSEEFRPS